MFQNFSARGGAEVIDITLKIAMQSSGQSRLKSQAKNEFEEKECLGKFSQYAFFSEQVPISQDSNDNKIFSRYCIIFVRIILEVSKRKIIPR